MNDPIRRLTPADAAAAAALHAQGFADGGAAVEEGRVIYDNILCYQKLFDLFIILLQIKPQFLIMIFINIL